jgi:hypothetical protein
VALVAVAVSVPIFLSVVHGLVGSMRDALGQFLVLSAR